jgi:hypothetical protein
MMLVLGTRAGMFSMRMRTAYQLSLVMAMVVSLICMGSASVVASDAATLRLATVQPTSNAFGGHELVTAGVATTGSVEFTQSCVPETIRRLETTRCEVTVANTSSEDVLLDLNTTTSQNLHIRDTDGAERIDVHHAQLQALSLAGIQPGVPTVAPGPSVAGYLPLDAFGTVPNPVGDEEILNFTVPAFEYAGRLWTTIGVSSNGYLVVGGANAEDNNCCELPSGPSSDLPNNVLAPFWTNLDGTDAPGIFIETLTDGVNGWIVVEFRLNVSGTTSMRVFQVWIGINGVQDITYVYDPANLPVGPFDQPFLVGAENTLGQGDMNAVLPTEDLRVSSTDPVSGDAVSYMLTVRG